MHAHNLCKFLWYDLPLSDIVVVRCEKTTTNEREEVEKLSTVGLSQFSSKFSKLSELLLS
jgi:hypothetical protein